MADTSSEERRQAKVAASMGSISRAGAADTTAEYDRLVSQAVELVNTPALDFLSAKERKLFLEKNLKKAESQCRRAIELDPARPAAYYALGCAQNASADGMAAAASFVKAMEFAHEEFSTEWANAAMHAFATLMANASAPRPAWWADAQLLVYSERALTALPEATLTLLWRAQVLSGLPLALPPLATQRSAEQLRTAATHYTAVAKLLTSKEEKRAAVEEAAACLVHAKRLDALETTRADAKRLDAQAAAAAASGSGGGGAASDAVVADDGDDGAGDDSVATAPGSSKNAAKNRKKKEKAKAKLAEQLLLEVEAGPDETATKGAHAPDGTAVTKDASASQLPLPPPGAPLASSGESTYRWADPLPQSCLAALAELGVVAGAFVSAIDLVGIAAEGGPEEAVAAGLIVPVPH
jgi:hypothetical protein